MTILRVDSSIRDEGSYSRALTARLAEGTEVVHRDLAKTPGLGDAWQRAALDGPTPLVTELVDELLAADEIVVGAPVYNFGVPVPLKAWLDLLVVDPRCNPLSTPMGTALKGVPVTLVVVSGWSYGPGSRSEGWNHATPFLRRIFADVFGADLRLEVVEGTVQNAA